WLMHHAGASAFELSLMATSASAPFFLFTLPAGAIADITNRRWVIVGALLWQAMCSAVLAVAAWMDFLSTSFVLVCIFALGIGLAFGAPVWGAIIPDIVSKEELPSAITLGGVQLNLSGIVGPALGGLLLPLFSAPALITINAITFVLVAFVVIQWRPPQTPVTRLRENFTESFISSLRYARNSPRMKTILFRNVLFSIVISVVPALLPVIALKECHSSAGQLGLIFTCVGIGSLVGAVFLLPILRQRMTPNGIVSTAMAIMIAVLLVMVFIRQVVPLMVMATFAGVAWALGGSEIWVAGQRVMPGWVRGRMNSFLIMIGQGSMALAAIVWGAGAANFHVDLTLAATAVIALISLALGRRYSINFSAEAIVDSARISHEHEFPIVPHDDDGPVTVTIEFTIMPHDREEFRLLIEEVQAICRRNGAFQCRLDESLEQPGSFRMEFILSTWAEHLRQSLRMTVDETEVYRKVWELHVGDGEPLVRHFLSTERSMHLPDFGFSGRTFMNTSRMPKPKSRLVAVTSDS
ncbi:MAG TPA: MFS transporter, partial [Terrimicrobiaceae bacterium]